MSQLRNPYFVLVLAVSVGLCMPLLQLGPSWFVSHEGSTYVERTVEWARGLHHGELYPRWCPDFYGGYGSPFFIFYAPVVYAAAGVLSASFLDPVDALKVVVVLTSIAAGAGMYFLVLGETRRADAALLAALLYLAAPYRLANLTVRGDLAELMCLGLLPGVLALYRRAALACDAHAAAAVAFAAAILHALAILSHTLIGMWGTGLVALVLAGTGVGLARRHAWRRAATLAVAFLAALGLSALYVVPAMAYRSFVRVDGMSSGMYDPQFNWIAPAKLFSREMYETGPLLVGAAALTTAALFRHRALAMRAAAWLIVALGFAALTLPHAAALWAPGRVPFAPYIQFPWRLLGPASLVAAVAAAIAWSACVPRGWAPRHSLAIAVGGAALLLLAGPRVALKATEASSFARDPEAVRAGMVTTTDRDEYLPRAVAARPSSASAALVVKAEDAEPRADWHEGAGYGLSLVAHGGHAAAHLALHHFPGWRVETVEGPAHASLRADHDGLATIDLPAAGTYVLRLSFGQPRAALIGAALSLLALLGTYPLLRRLSRARAEVTA